MRKSRFLLAVNYVPGGLEMRPFRRPQLLFFTFLLKRTVGSLRNDDGNGNDNATNQ